MCVIWNIAMKLSDINISLTLYKKDSVKRNT